MLAGCSALTGFGDLDFSGDEDARTDIDLGGDEEDAAMDDARTADRIAPPIDGATDARPPGEGGSS